MAWRISAQTITNVVETFDTNSYPNNSITNKWSNWFGGAFVSLSLDPAMDANTNAASGSLKIVANFPTNTDQFLHQASVEDFALNELESRIADGNLRWLTVERNNLVEELLVAGSRLK